MNVQKLYIIDSLHNAKIWLKKYFRENEKYVVIALYPDVYVFLLKRGINVSNTQHYLNNESHKKLLLKSDEIISEYRKRLSLKEIGRGINNAFRECFIFGLRYDVQHNIATTELLLSACHLHKPEEICAFKPGSDTEGAFSLDLTFHVGSVVENAAKLLNINFIALHSGNRLSRAGVLLRRHLHIYKYFLKWIFLKFKIILLPLSNKQRGVVCTTGMYNLEKLISKLKLSDNYKTYCLPSENFIADTLFETYLRYILPRRYKDFLSLKLEIIKFTKENPHLQTLQCYRSVRFSDLLEVQILNKIVPYLCGFYMWSILLERYFKKLSPLVIISVGNRGDEILIAELARQLKIKSLLVSHGSHVPTSNNFEKIEWGQLGLLLMRSGYEYVALQTPLAEQYCEEFEVSSKKIRSGPLIWGLPIKKSKRSDNSFIIVHASTPKRYFQRFHVYETQDEYIQTLQALSEAVLKLNSCKLVIKFRPHVGFSEKTLKYFIPKAPHIQIDTNTSFQKILAEADLLISFSSTCIEDALQNNIPVLLYGCSGRYEHIKSEKIQINQPVKKTPIYFIENPYNLEVGLKKIKDIIEEGIEPTCFKPFQYQYKNPVQILQETLGL